MAYDENQQKYGYGIEEYINSAFFNLNQIIKKSLYLQHYWDNGIFNKTIFIVIEIFLIKYLQKKEMFTQISVFDFLKKIEVLRHDTKLKYNNELRLLLSIYPTKFHFLSTIFNNYNEQNSFYKKELINIDTLYESFKNIYGEDKIIYLNELTFDNLSKFNITCYNSVLSTSMEWCITPYLEEKHKNENCPPANFYSGFYFDNPPSLNIGIMRQPADLKYAITALDTNKLKIPLNKSDYKLYVEKDNFIKDTLINIDNSKCHIKPALQNIILKFGDEVTTDFGLKMTSGELIALEISLLKPGLITQSELWVPLIWKALNYAGYDVKPECLNIVFDDNEKYNKFNKLVIKLAELPKWPEYAANILLYDNDNYKSTENDFDSEKVINKANSYKSFKGKDHSQYKMAIYEEKYKKYKQKYIELKKNI
jgi:hypothetical protein